MDQFPTFRRWAQRPPQFLHFFGASLLNGLILGGIYSALFIITYEYSNGKDAAAAWGIVWFISALFLIPFAGVLGYFLSPQGRKYGYAPSAFKGFLRGLPPVFPLLVFSAFYCADLLSDCSADLCFPPMVFTGALPLLPLASALGGLIRYFRLRSAARADAALSPLKEAAVRGEAAAMAELGARYRSGDGVDADEQQAARWLGLAADAGHAPSKALLGWIYYKGQGLKKDAAKAKTLWQEAAETGEAQAQLGLGVLYFTGEGGETSGDKAFEWWTKAAAQGDETAKKNLEELARIRGR